MKGDTKFSDTDFIFDGVPVEVKANSDGTNTYRILTTDPDIVNKFNKEYRQSKNRILSYQPATPLINKNSAQEFKRFIKSFNITHQDIATALGKDTSVATRWLSGGKENKIFGTVEEVELLHSLFYEKLNRYSAVSYTKKQITSLLNFFLNVPSTDIITDDQYRRLDKAVTEVAANVKQLNNTAGVFDEAVNAINENTSTRKLHTKKIAELEKRIDTLFGGEVKPVNEIDIKSLTTDLNVLLENYRRGHDVQRDVETMLSNFNLDSYDKEKVAKNIQLEQLKKFVQEQKDQEAPF